MWRPPFRSGYSGFEGLEGRAPIRAARANPVPILYSTSGDAATAAAILLCLSSIIPSNSKLRHETATEGQKRSAVADHDKPKGELRGLDMYNQFPPRRFALLAQREHLKEDLHVSDHR